MKTEKVLSKVEKLLNKIYDEENVEIVLSFLENEVYLKEEVFIREFEKEVEEYLTYLEDKNYMENENQEKLPYMMSLYDYLGKPAGKQLGGEVNKVAKALQETIQERPISNPKFTGNVHLYRREFLDEYFGNKIYEGDLDYFV